MKYLKIFLLILSILFCVSVQAEDFEKIKYKNLKDGAKISFDGINWTQKVNKKSGNYYIKKVSEGTKFSEFYSPNGEFLFSTGSHYEFLKNGSLIGYSNGDLKFYEYRIVNNILESRELNVGEVEELFPKYKVIKISDFSTATNSLKIKKGFKDLKIILYNDNDGCFYNYGYSTNNAEFKSYELRGFLDITKYGMIQFSHLGTNSKNTPWYILLIRK